MQRYFIILLCTLLSPVRLLADTQTVVQPSPAKPAASVQWLRWSPDTFAKAHKASKLILVDLAADWCTFCKKMDQTTWRDSKVLSSIDEHYIPVRIQDEVDATLAERYRSYGRPAFVVLDANGKEIARKRGYLAPQWMYWMLEGIAENPTAEGNR